MQTAFDGLLATLDLPRPAYGDVTFEGSDPVFACRFPLGGLAASVVAACGWTVSELWQLRTGRRQQVRVSVRDAAASLLSFLFLRAPGLVERGERPTVGFYRGRDGRWIHLHGGFPHLAQGTLRLLECRDDAGEIARAVAGWDATMLEEALAEARLCGAAVRSADEWAALPQGRSALALPVVEVTRIGDAPPEPIALGERPLSGLRVLDLTRVLAGPTCGRTLAEHGADVLRVASPRLPDVERFRIDTGHGKRATALDLDVPDDARRLAALAAGADVFVGGYRSGTLERRGFSPDALATARPGIVCVSINCYGHAGPWRERGGWEQLAQSVTGLAAAHGDAVAPALVPVAACDYTTGALAALGTLVALLRRAREGGSWHVRASLCQTGSWIERHGSAALLATPPRALAPADISARSQDSVTAFGRITHLGPVVRLSETPPRWDLPSPAPGADPPVWIARP